jgi:hypothetical protein
VKLEKKTVNSRQEALKEVLQRPVNQGKNNWDKIHCLASEVVADRSGCFDSQLAAS